MSSVFSYPYEFDVWDQLITRDIATLQSEGMAIDRKFQKDMLELLKGMTRRMVIGGISVPVANLPYTFSSEAGHLMAQGEPFAACYWDTPNGRVFSLRSSDVGQDVSAVAKLYGGGGHRNAAGFSVPFSHPLASNTDICITPE
jgi:oligoribonuclease NrnB/cAMP/cGMP phosphodiesterase (DHH superfamily)